MNCKLLTILSVLLLALTAQADNKAFKKAQEQAQAIQLDDTYLYGMGVGNTYTDADRNALQDLLSKISVNMTSQIDIVTEEINENGNINSKNAMQAVINTYASGTLSNTENLQLSDDPQAQVMRFVKKSEIEKIFAQRVERVRDYMRMAATSEKRLSIDDALRYYYWAFNLLKSVQHASAVTAKVNGEDVHPLQWIPQHMNDIMSDIKVRVSSVEDNLVELLVTYQDKPVTSLEFNYYDGMSWVQNTGARDGLAEMEMRPGASTDNLQLRFEYEFRGEARQDSELEQVMQVFKSTPLKRSSYTIKNATKKERKEVQKEFQQVVKAEADAPNTNAAEVKADRSKELTKVVERIVASIKSKKYDDVKDCFTPEGYDMYLKIINYGQASLMGTPTFSFYPMLDKLVCRGIPMKFTFKNNNRTFVETVTFTFNQDKKIESLAFALDQAAREDIFNKAVGYWNDSIRMILANFLENYKTAFALKRLDYLESIFDDNAVIITGSIVKPAAKVRENEQFVNNKLVRYNKRNKSEYMRSLKQCFGSNQFINIRFADNDISRMSRQYGATYGIQIKQDYYSSSYSDTGYLFLMIDMNNPQQPIIKVRTWQPERDPSLSHPDLSEDRFYGIYSGGNF